MCKNKNLDYDLVYTTKPKEAIGLSKEAASNFATVIAVGGDGTVHETVNGLIGSKTKFGGNRTKWIH